MRWIGTLTRFWAWLSTALVGLIILFLFGYVFEHGAREYQPGIFNPVPERNGIRLRGRHLASYCGKPVFYRCRRGDGEYPGGGRGIVSGILLQKQKKGIPDPSGDGMHLRPALHRAGLIFLHGTGTGFRAWTLHFVRQRGPGHHDPAFYRGAGRKGIPEVPDSVVQSACALGCSKAHTIRKVVFPACRGELVSGMILGGCYAMGATAPGHVHGSRSVCDRTPQPACSGHVAAAASVSAAVPGGNLHACSVWDSICNDGADPGGKYGGSRVCGALSETVERVETGGVKN